MVAALRLTIGKRAAEAIRYWLVSRCALRSPDRVIGEKYLRRWYVIPRNRWFNVYLHHFQGSDDARALHDHPWWNLSLLLSGEYREVTNSSAKTRRPGDIVIRSAKAAHRIEMTGLACWTVFITGPRVRSWGFICPNGWRHWREYENGGGCD